MHMCPVIQLQSFNTKYRKTRVCTGERLKVVQYFANNSLTGLILLRVAIFGSDSVQYIQARTRCDLQPQLLIRGLQWLYQPFHYGMYDTLLYIRMRYSIHYYAHQIHGFIYIYIYNTQFHLHLLFLVKFSLISYLLLRPALY